MLDIQTFDARRGGNVLYKALTHPLAAEALAILAAELRQCGGFALFDPDGVAAPLFALHPDMPAPAEYFVQNVELLTTSFAGISARPITDLKASSAATLLIAAFDTGRLVTRLRPLLPAAMAVRSLDDARLPEALLTNRRQYLDRLNFATNHVFFRDRDGLSSRLVSANYWAGYGAKEVSLWLRLFDADGTALATWTEVLPQAGGFAIDSRDVRARFNLPPFAGQIFLHAVGVAGHDVVKYALDIYGTGGEPSLSVTHDANAWPSDRYAGLPAPRADEQVTLWVQNSHAAPIPAGAIALDRMGAEAPVTLMRDIGPYASLELDVAALLPGVAWPAQVEVRTGRHVVRPRYEVRRAGRTRIAHVNVERADLRPDPGIKGLHNLLGRGYLLPFPILPPDRFRTIFQPNPMAESQTNLPLRLDVFAENGMLAAQKFLGCLPRDHDVAMDLDAIAAAPGHAELVYDFRAGGDADGWLHGLFRYEHRETGHAAETSFGGHIFNTAMTYKDEPQSYNGPPPGLSTRLFLKLGDAARRSFAVLIYAASAPWHERSATTLLLIGGDGATIAEHDIAIACCGSVMVFPHEIFGEAALQVAGARGYVLVRDTTCRLFGYHGLMNDAGGFSLDHMFGF
ncbi:MAG TPA: hypothetical protein VMB71_09930 [Acetobacteraceae bacterium]|nr:hypothetical protein [Acetobacteraceae bacterium]